ncbi:MAG TPA: type II toxin-antitoxin system RelE/ParE family toxin [Bryobacteraceae bacterium]|nr:type II toxin-antitoxin system RelE/ParE family toxin [Bryobacteraceae bacterium]
MTWILQVTKPAEKDLRRLTARDRERVRAALLATQADPFSGDIKRLRNQPAAWRRRCGEYRIFYDLYAQRLIVVVAIARRTSTTY